MKPVEGIEDKSNIIKSVKVDNMVSVKTKEGQKMEFKVIRIGEDAIFGDGVQVNFSDIKEIKVEKLSKGKSIAAGVGVYIAIGIIAFIEVFSKLLAF